MAQSRHRCPPREAQPQGCGSLPLISFNFLKRRIQLKMLQLVLLTSSASPLVSPTSPQPGSGVPGTPSLCRSRLLRNVRSIFGPFVHTNSSKSPNGQERAQGSPGQAAAKGQIQPRLLFPHALQRLRAALGLRPRRLCFRQRRGSSRGESGASGGAGVSPEVERTPGSVAVVLGLCVILTRN